MIKYKIVKREYPEDVAFPVWTLYEKNSWATRIVTCAGRWTLINDYKSEIDAKLKMKSLVYREPRVTETSYFYENGHEELDTIF